MNYWGDLEGIDALWMAVDQSEHVAILTTGGQGPFPLSSLATIDKLERLIFDLPLSSGAELAGSMWEGSLAFAKRGLFAYDWSDVHRTTATEIHGYELEAKPLEPIKLAQLPERLRIAAASTKIDVVFGAAILPRSLLGT